MSRSSVLKHASSSSLGIDFFKKYNDHYGHPQGDIALQKSLNK